MALTESTATQVAPAPVDEAEAENIDAYTKLWEEINPCPVCGSMQDAGPEKEARNALHCWKCGFRPGQTITAAMAAGQTGVTQAQIDQLQKGIVADVLAALQSGQVPTVTFPTPSDAPAPAAQPPAAS